MFEIGEKINWVINTVSGKHFLKGVIYDIDEGQEYLNIIVHIKDGIPHTAKVSVKRTMLKKCW